MVSKEKRQLHHCRERGQPGQAHARKNGRLIAPGKYPHSRSRVPGLAQERAGHARACLGGGGIYQRDYPVVQGAVVLVALCFILVNLAVDLVYGLLDPRVRYESA